MKRTQNFLIALSLANLCFFKQWSDLTNWKPFESFYEPVAAYPASYVALYLGVVVLAVFFWGILEIGRAHATNKKIFHFSHFALFPALFFALNGVRLSLNDHRFSIGYLVQSLTPIGAGVLFLGSFVFFAWMLLRKREGLVLAFRSVMTVMFPLLLLNVFQTGFYFKREAVIAPKYQKKTAKSEHRVIWMVFDGLDYRVTFPERPKGLELPHLDRLAKESVFSEHAIQPAEETNKSIPSFLLGKTVTRAIAPDDKGKLNLSLEKDFSVENWDASETIFAKLHQLGRKTAVAGWHLPYCQMLGDYVDSCLRLPHYNVRKYEYHKELLPSLASFTKELVTLKWSDPRTHLRNYQKIFDRAQELALDESIDLSFIHWPIPHNPVIYDAKNKELSHQLENKHEGYFDNLVLLDDTIGKIRTSLEKNKLWEDTTLLITSDHASRAIYFKDNKKDTRVPFILKLANQKTGLVLKEPMSALMAHPIILDLLRKGGGQDREYLNWL